MYSTQEMLSEHGECHLISNLQNNENNIHVCTAIHQLQLYCKIILHKINKKAENVTDAKV